MSNAFTKSSTPILDLESPFPQTRQWDRLSWRQAVLIVALPLVGVILLVPTFLVLNDNNPAVAKIFKYIGTKIDAFSAGSGAQSPLAFFLFYFLALFLTLLIHELGHVAAGFVVGFHFRELRIGPLTLVKSSKGLKVALQRISTLDGIAASVPSATGAVASRLLGSLTPGTSSNWARCLAWMAAQTAPLRGIVSSQE